MRLSDTIKKYQPFLVLVALCSFVFNEPISAQTVGPYVATKYTTSGNKTYTVPAGVTKIKVECWGGGGRGGSVTNNTRSGGGGGGGAYASKIITVSGSSYTLTVGTGSTGTGVGGSSSFATNQVIAVGGNSVASNNNTTGAAGGSASACTGDVKKSGGQGGSGSNNNYSGGGGGAGGASGDGGAGSLQTGGIGGFLYGGNGADGVTVSFGNGSNGNAGNPYGGGGSGAMTYSSGTDRNGGNGGVGAVVVTPVNVEVTASLGVTADSYANVGDAFKAINAGVHRGSITVKILRSIVEPEYVVLNSSGTGSADYTSINVYPTASDVTLSGAFDGTPLIDFFGADNVTIDGRVNATGSAASMTIVNTSTSGNASTITFESGAQNNTIKYCTIKGGGGATYNGTLTFLSNSTNSGNTIDNCIITNNGTRRPYALFSSGGASNTISNSTFFNTWSKTTSSTNIYLTGASYGWIISGNSFYDTELASISTSGITYRNIQVQYTSNGGFAINQNYFGGHDVACGGSPMLIGTDATSDVAYQPIFMSATSGSTSTLDGNVIRNINMVSLHASPFAGVYVQSGQVDTKNTLIGDVSGNTLLKITSSATSATSYGIQILTGDAQNITGNVLSMLKLESSNSSYAHSFYGIYVGAVWCPLTISGNQIGHASTLNAISTTSTSTSNAQVLYGIYSASSNTVSISNNLIANLQNSTTNTAVSTVGTVAGIYSGAGTNTVNGNTVYNLSISNANNSAATPSVFGIFVTNGNSYSTVSGNSIHDLTNNSTSSSSVIVVGLIYGGLAYNPNVVEKNYIYKLSVAGASGIVGGMLVNSGSTTYSNNLIVLNPSQNNTLYGVYNMGGSNNTFNFYHNTVYLGGTASGSANSYALFLNASDNTRDIRNNILANVRSGSGTNYAIYYNATGLDNLTADYNNYRATGTNGMIGYYSGNRTFADLKTTVGKDQHSLDSDPVFRSEGSLNPEDYKTRMQLSAPSVGITTDFAGINRTSFNLGVWEFSPVELWSNGVYRSSYNDLKTAFTQINNGVWTGAISIRLLGSTTESSTAILNANGAGSASYSSVLIYPDAAGLTISGNFNSPLIQLNGADNVRINGSVLMSNNAPSLTFTNTNGGASASILTFSESAQNNSVRYVNLKGNPTSTTTGVVHFSTSSIGTGNSADTIAFCTISGIGATSTARPNNAIYSSGSSSAKNANIQILGNNLYDFLKHNAESNGILLASNTESVTIANNSFYETTAFAGTTSSTHTVININNNLGGRFIVTGNYIGGNAALANGTWTKTGTSNDFQAMDLVVASTPRSSVQGNSVTNFDYTNSSNAKWYGINIAGGGVDVGTVTGNAIGNATSTESIKLTNNATGGSFYGMYLSSSDSVSLYNNTIGSVSVGMPTVSSTLAFNLYGIYKTAVGGNLTVQNNTIGSPTTENSLIARSQATGNVQELMGFYSEGTASVVLKGNTIANLVNATTSTQIARTRGILTMAGSNTIDNNLVHHLSTLDAQANNYENGTLIGIAQQSTTDGTTQNVRGNQVYNLKNLSTATVEMYGIYFKCPTSGTHEVSRNFVHTFQIISTDAAYIHGISLYSGSYTCSNNVVFIGSNITTGCSIWGIWCGFGGSTYKIYHNTVYLSGQASTGTSNSFAFRDLCGNPVSRDVRNNIFWNGRTNTTNITHYAIYLASTTNTTLNYNDYQFSQQFGRINTTDYLTFAAWKTGTSLDANSIQVNPQLTNLGGTSPSDYQPGVATLIGTPLAGFTKDFGYMDRSTSQPTMGAWEYLANPVEIWNGTVFRQSYSKLRTAFDAINAGTWVGNLTVKIKANTTEDASAILYKNGYTGSGGTSSYTKVTIYPARTDIQVRGQFAAPLVSLDGASNVVFDGRVDGTGSAYNLTLLNRSTATTASTVKYVNSAAYDTIQYCYIKGLNTATAGGIVFLSTATSGLGNSYNVFYRNKITVESETSTRVVNALYSEGSSSYENRNNRILENEFYNVWNPSVSSNAIHLSSNNSNWFISGNSLYETSAFAPTGAFTYQGIRINTNGSGFTLTGNYIGGRAAQTQNGIMTISSGSAAAFIPVYMNTGNGSLNSLQSNVINNIGVTTTASNPFAAIWINAGATNVGTESGNTIGSSAVNGVISLTSSATTASSYGVYVNSQDAVLVSNNAIGGLTAVNSNTANGHSLYGIYKTAVLGSFTLSGNVIGSQTLAQNIQSTSTSTGQAQSVYGIYSLGTGTTNILGNTISNLLNATTFSSANSNVGGIYFGGNSATIERNFIYKLQLSVITNSALNSLSGIYLAQGSTQVQNNIIWVGEGVTGRYYIYGIYDNGVSNQTNQIYHNTILLTGTPGGTSQYSAAYRKANDAGLTVIRNNIFYNNRTTNATHYAVWLPGTNANNVTINANDYVCNGTLSNWLSWARTNLDGWQNATGQDGNSKNVAPFSIPSSEVASNFKPTLDLYGIASSILQDYGQNLRNTSQPTIGAWERTNKWKGNVSIDFNNAGNWTFNMVPAAYDNVVFDDIPLRHCTLDQNRYVTNVVNGQSVFRLVLNGKSLTLKGSMNFSNGAQMDASADGSILELNGTSLQSIPAGAFYQNKVYNLVVNNPNTVELNGTMILLNQLSVTSGRLNAANLGTTINYGGTNSQSINSNQFLNDRVFNLGIQNPAGVTLTSNFTVDNNMVINSGATLSLNETTGLTVTGTITNNAGNTGLLLKSSASGTASLIHTTANVPATVQRYIGGVTDAWHFLSAPVSNQAILNTGWTPAGTHGDGTGYDLYAWNESNSCWLYNLDNAPGGFWTTYHPQTTFVPGRGYLYALQSALATKSFTGLLNSGSVTRAVTNSINAVDTLKGFNLLGNPYPSSINWKTAAGFTRSMLKVDQGGNWIWVWSPSNNNYGVFNSGNSGVTGTNGVTAYISPMQAFFVEAASSGNFVFNDAARTHIEAGNWLRSANSFKSFVSAVPVSNLNLAVSGAGGGDEVQLNIGYSANEGGARKLFSPVAEAPSLYINWRGLNYSTQRLTSNVTYLPVSFKAGIDGTFTLRSAFDANEIGQVYLEDRKTHAIIELTSEPTYTFVASKTDDKNRFVLHFGEITSVDENIHPSTWSNNGTIYVKLDKMIGNYSVSITTLDGRIISTQKMAGGEQFSLPLNQRSVCLVKVEGEGKIKTIKVVM